jgi:HD superfamily phosphodiesterase
MTDWLTQLKTGLKEITLPPARKFWPGLTPESEPYFNYRYMHVEQVERDARRLMAAYGGDEDIMLASVWIHDRYKPQFGGEDHATKAAEWARENLEGLGFPAEKVAEVIYAVSHHEYDSRKKQKIPADHPEARMLWDADKVGKIGASMLVFVIAAGGAFPQNKLDFTWLRRELRNWEHFGQQVANEFYYPLAREMCQKRYAILKAYCDALEEETN